MASMEKELKIEAQARSRAQDEVKELTLTVKQVESRLREARKRLMSEEDSRAAAVVELQAWKSRLDESNGEVALLKRRLEEERACSSSTAQQQRRLEQVCTRTTHHCVPPPTA